jgi:predicted dienelactone hydrolase
MKLFLPSKGKRWPVIFFSHGHEVDPRTYHYLARAWSSDGFAVFVLHHRGLSENIRHERYLPRRSRDVFAALRAAKSSRLKNLDLSRVGVAGHSLGAHTALVSSGARLFLRDGKQPARALPGLKACLVMSPSPEGQLGLRKSSCREIRCPVAIFSSARDFKMGRRTAARALFEAIPHPEKSLCVLPRGNHLSFIDAAFKDGEEWVQFPNQAFLRETALRTLRFWRASLR